MTERYVFDSNNISERARKRYAKHVGQVYGDYKVLEAYHDNNTHNQFWKMQCVKCGKIIEENSYKYRKGNAKGICECTIKAKQEEQARQKVERAIQREQRRAERLLQKEERSRIWRESHNDYSDATWIGKKFGHFVHRA